MGTTTENIRARVSLVDKMSPGLSRISKSVMGIGAAFLGWKAITGIMKSIIELGSEHVRIWVNVEAALVRHNQAVDDGIGKVRRFADEMQTLTGISDEYIGTSVKMFVDYGLSLEDAMSTMKVAADFASGSGQELKMAVDLLAKASVGYTGTLARYGLIIDENIPKTEKFAAAIALINERYGGAAQDQADTMSVKISLMTEKWGDLQEQLFKTFSPALASSINIVTDSIDLLIGAASGSDIKLVDLYTNINKLEDFKKDDSSFVGWLMEVDKWLEELFDPSISALVVDIQALNDGMKKVSEQELKPPGGLFDPKFFDEADERYNDYYDNLLSKNENALVTMADATNVLSMVQSDADNKAIEAANKRNDSTNAAIEKNNEYTETSIWNTELIIAADEGWASASISISEQAGKRWEAFTSTRITDAMRMSRVLTGTMNEASRNIVGSLKFLHTESSGVFRNMAADFSRLFIQEILDKMVVLLVPKMLGILGSIFDTRANDVMAMRQGADFGRFFKDGVISEVNPDSMSLVFNQATEFESEIQRQNMTGGTNVAIF